MTPEEKQLLEETAALTKETHRLVGKVYKHLFWGSVTRAVYWVVIIGASLGAFYLIQPYIDSIQSLTGSGDGAEKSLIENYLGF